MQQAQHRNWSGDRLLDVVVVGGSQAGLAEELAATRKVDLAVGTRNAGSSGWAVPASAGRRRRRAVRFADSIAQQHATATSEPGAARLTRGITTSNRVAAA